MVFPNIFTKHFDFAMQTGADGFNHGRKMLSQANVFQVYYTARLCFICAERSPGGIFNNMQRWFLKGREDKTRLLLY